MSIRFIRKSEFHEISEEEPTTCNSLSEQDMKLMRELIEASNRDDRERGFKKCNGTMSDVCLGTECRTPFSEVECPQGTEIEYAFHTHPGPIGVPIKGHVIPLSEYLSEDDYYASFANNLDECMGYRDTETEEGNLKVKCVRHFNINVEKIIDEIKRMREGNRLNRSLPSVELRFKANFELVKNTLQKLEKEMKVCEVRI